MTPENAGQKRLYDFLMESQFWPENRIVAYQRSQLSQLLRFAFEKVPFYRDRLKPVMRPGGEIDWSRWNEIPILKRQDLIDHRESMLAPEVPPGHAIWSDHEGSGTTGKPVTTRHNMLTHVASMAAFYRANEWHKINYGGVFLQWIGELPLDKADPLGDRRGPWGPEWHAESKAGMFIDASVAFPPEQVVRMIVERRVNYLSGRPLAMQALALAAERMGVQHKIDSVFGFGTAASEEMREDCLRVFGAEIISLYASKEVYNIAHQCPLCKNQHVNSELLLLEVVDDDDRPLPSNSTGRAIVTSFFNTAQPFIRYDLGDRIIMAETQTCGRMLPAIRQVVGRSAHLFRFPNGRKIAPNLGPDARARVRKLAGAAKYQIAQTATGTIELRYVSDGSGREPDFNGLTELFRLYFDPTANFSCRQIAALPLTPSGKFIDYVCELPPET